MEIIIWISILGCAYTAICEENPRWLRVSAFAILTILAMLHTAEWIMS